MRARLDAWLLLNAALLCARAAIAQTVTGRVVAKADGAAVSGAIVALLDSSGRAVTSGLAEDDGRFRLDAPAAGRFSVRVERVGFRSSTSAPVVVAQDATVDIPIAISADGISLRAVRVNADRRCIVRPQEGLAAAQLWDEARKALSATQLTQLAQAAARSRRDPHRFMVRTRKFARDLAPNTLKPVHEEQFELDGEAVTPFVSEDPEVLHRDGYMAGTMEAGTIYYAPDAAILLSDQFLDGHCFRVAYARDRDDLIGLAFEPVHLTRNREGHTPHVEIMGVLWLDRSTAELRFMEYHYVDLPVDVPNEAAGGLLEFRPLPDGRWIVWRWYVRAPRLVERRTAAIPYMNVQSQSHLELSGIHEEGAEILEVLPPESQRRLVASVRGIVLDSIRHAPLAGVRVFLSGTSFAALTAPDGSYTIEGIRPGVYVVSVLAARLDSLLLDAPAMELTLNAGEDRHIDFAVPSVRTLSARLCPDVTPGDSTSIIVGVVRDTSNFAAPGARVRAEWQVFSKPASDRLVQQPVLAETKTVAAGRFALCGLPTNRAITVEALRGGNSDVSPVLHLVPAEVRRVDLRLRAP